MNGLEIQCHTKDVYILKARGLIDAVTLGSPHHEGHPPGTFSIVSNVRQVAGKPWLLRGEKSKLGREEKHKNKAKQLDEAHLEHTIGTFPSSYIRATLTYFRWVTEVVVPQLILPIDEASYEYVF